jgi:hypothetical protein
MCNEEGHTKRSCKKTTRSVSAANIDAETDITVIAPVKVENTSDEENKLQVIFTEIKQCLTVDKMAEMLSMIHALSEKFKGDGGGLTSGSIIDEFLAEYFPPIIKTFKKCHNGEVDCSILDHSLSLKKISGKSILALDWSKNNENSKKRERFTTHIMIINLKTEQWWKTYPSGCTKEEIDSKFYQTPVKAGIYLISKIYCKANIILSSNNKTNSLITNKFVYKMLKESIKNNMFIEFPTNIPKKKYSILTGFTLSE